MFGRNVAMPADVRYHAYTGSDQEIFQQIICVASHQVASITEVWFDNEKAWGPTAALGRYATSPTGPFLWIVAYLSGGVAVTIDSVWTAACKLTGCASLHLKYRLVDGGGERNDSPFAGGITNRITIRGNGALLYDPRLDSTVTGGSGPQRADAQSTWTNTATSGDNPALQLLFYLLGWRINSKLAVGMGMPPVRIDLPSFITAANLCDETVTLAAGGTEKRYRSNGVISEGDDRTAVIENLCASMNGILRDAGGKISLTVVKNDLATPVLALNLNDILGDEQWDQTSPIQDSFNIVRGQWINPSDNALYQPSEYPEVKLDSVDGIDRITSLNFPLVQSSSQAQRLAKQFLQRNQYQGIFSAVFGPRALQVSLGNVVTLTHEGLGWLNKLFRITDQAISKTGEIRMTLIEEHADIYQWDAEEAPAVEPPAPTIYDPLLHPLMLPLLGSGSGGNLLRDTHFGSFWVKSIGAVRINPLAVDGYAAGSEPFAIQLSPNTSTEESAFSERVPVNTGTRYYFSARASRGTTLGSGSRLNFGGQWLASDGVTLVAVSAEGAQQSPTTLLSGALPGLPIEIRWSDVAPTGAAFFRMKLYTPALANSSGTFRVEKPIVSRTEPGANPGPITGEATITIYADVTGTPKVGEIPKSAVYQLVQDGTPIASGVTWMAALISGNATFTTSGTGTGELIITGPNSSALAVESVIRLTATHGSGVYTLDVKTTRTDDPPTTGGGTGGGTGGTTTATTTLGNTTGATYDLTNAISGVITVQPGSNGNVVLTAPITYGRLLPKEVGETKAWAKWQWRVPAGSWADVTTEVGASMNAKTTEDPESGWLFGRAGSISVSQTKSSLTPATNYEFRLAWRAEHISGTSKQLYRVTGTMQGVGN